MDPGEIGPTPAPGIPGPARGEEAAGHSGPGADVPSGEGLLTHVLGEVPDVILMFQVAPEGRLRCQTAMSSHPTAPALSSLVGRALEEILPPDALRRFAARYEEASAQQGAVRYEEWIRRADRDVVLDTVLTPVFDENGVPSHLFWSARDMTREQTTAVALRESEERFNALFDTAAIGIAWVDPDGGFIEVNQALCGILGYSTDKLLTTSVVELTHPDERDEMERLMQDLANGGRVGGKIETRLLHERGHPVWVQASLAGTEGYAHRYMLQLQDLTERRGLQERLAHQALHDPLTGLPNRALFLDRMGRAVSRLDRTPAMVAVMIVDIDRFDVINERHGHDFGDRVLVRLAELLGVTIRQADTISRLSGDEFALLFEEFSSERDVLTIAGRVRETVEGTIELEGNEVQIEASIGVALTEDSRERPEALLRDAGLALEQAKVGGRGRTEIFDESMRAETARRLKTETDLRRAIEEGEFRVFYQPQISLRTGTIAGVEVLARWEHPERGLVTPSEFLEAAEDTGIIVPMGIWVMEQACAQAERWRTQRAGDPLITWINLSAVQLAQPDLTEVVRKVLAESGVDPATVCFEVTESILMDETPTAVAALRSLKDLGVKVGIDDFGRGYSSLAYLKQLPIDMLKIDRTFVSGLAQSEEESAIASAVINLARAMGLTSIAEGVETAEQLAVLRKLGCDLAHGYFFASPQPPEVVTELISQNLRW